MENEIEAFHREILEEIRNEAKINYTDPTSEFLSFYTDKLLESEEILEFEEYDIEVVGTNNRKGKVDGYSFDSLDGTISLFIADFNNSNELTRLTNSTINQCHNRVLNYLDFVFNHFIKKHLEESSLAYQLATDILNKKNFIHKIKIYILSDSILSTYVKNISVENYLDKKVEIIIWDLNRIHNLMNSALKKEDLNINIEDFSEEKITCIRAISNEKYNSYLAIVNGELLANLYLKYGSRLLEGNVRSFLSVRGKINKGIRNTIRDEPEIFFVYNNGIACTATDANIIKTSDGLFIKSLTNFQIINGGQTTASIANAVLQDNAKINVKKIYIPMKLTVIDKRAFSKEELDIIDRGDIELESLTEEQKRNIFVESLTSNIARYANSQNKVDESDFFSNHPFHIRFESLARKIYAPPSKGIPYETIWFYERAKGQYIQEQMKLSRAEKKRFLAKYPKKQLIKKIDLAKYIMTFEQYPHIVSKGNQFNMRIFANKIEKLWKENKDHSNFNNYYYKKCISLAIMFRGTELLVSKSNWYKTIRSYRANIVTYTISSLFYMIHDTHPNLELNYLKIWNDQEMYSELVEQLNDLSFKVYEKITESNRGTENVTEWCKKEACWQSIQELINDRVWTLSQKFVITLIRKVENKAEMKNEKKEQKENDGINAQTRVINLGDMYWQRILEWGIKMKIISETEISFLKVATNFTKKIPTDKQCVKILEIREKLIYEGFR